ncbi:13070_t:CDS:1, partial [Entrophospora sp. SA101]
MTLSTLNMEKQILGHNYLNNVVITLPAEDYGYKWENKLFFNSNGTPPNKVKDWKYLAIIKRIDRDKLFTNLPEPETLYPRPKSYANKQPRPMNCVLILLKVVNLVAAGVNL